MHYWSIFSLRKVSSSSLIIHHGQHRVRSSLSKTSSGSGRTSDPSSPISALGSSSSCDYKNIVDRKKKNANLNHQDGSSRRTFSSPLSNRAGIVILGSAAGLFYYGLSSSTSPETTSGYVVYADTGIDLNKQDSDVQEKKKKPIYIFGDDYRRKVFFNYEKRIRLRSPPEKVFEYFASVHAPNGESYMTPADLMRAVVPVFPASESNHIRGGYLKGEKPPGELQCAPSEFFMLFDTDGDGLISFPEYVFLVTLLSIPESSFSVAFKMFDLDHNGEIDKEEFKKVMALMRTYNRQGRQHRNGKRIGMKVSDTVENGGLIKYFFGKDGNQSLKHETFVQFLRDLHEEIVRLEFAHYDFKGRGTISARDFALSMVASADMSHTNKFLEQVDQLSKHPQLNSIRISFEEFKSFAELRKSLRPLSLAMFGHGKINGLLSRNDFRRAASHVCGICLTNNMIDIIFHVFDTNKDGSLSSDEFVRVLHRRERSDSDGLMPRDTGKLKGLLACWSECMHH